MTEPQYDVAIVGAGFAGLYLLHRCRSLGLTARVWEAGDGVGGTWYWNRYPGARCDIESMQYSYQFDEALQQEWNWSERYATQPEILRYAEHVAERFKLLDGIDFGRRVSTATWDQMNALWTLQNVSGESLTAQFCVLATGCLSAPNWPVIDGYEAFNGPVHHTALWPHEGVDFNGKKVAVIGTGSSGIQSIPRIAEAAEHLTVFQRTPNYSVPARNRPLDSESTDKIKASYPKMRADAKKNYGGIHGSYRKESALAASHKERAEEYERRWQYGGLTFLGSYGDLLKDEAANDTLVEFVHNKIKGIVEDLQTASLLCPENIIGGKRMCVDIGYYETYNRNNVELVDIRQNPIDEITTTGLTCGGKQYSVDIIIVATGFDAMTGALNRTDIHGRDGTLLSDRWAEGASSYLGLAMAGYPNLFTVTGPGSPSVLTNMLPTIEQHVEWISDCIAYTKSSQYSIIEATSDAEQIWWDHVQEIGAAGIKQSAESWYIGANIKGKPRVFTPYNGGFPEYCRKCEEVVARGYEGFLFS